MRNLLVLKSVKVDCCVLCRVDSFTVSCPEMIGELQYIRIKQTGSAYLGWYLDAVFVRDTGFDYKCQFRRWVKNTVARCVNTEGTSPRPRSNIR